MLTPVPGRSPWLVVRSLPGGRCSLPLTGLLLACLILGCSKSSRSTTNASSGTASASSQPSGFAVAGVLPADGAQGVSVTTPLQVTFSAEVDATSMSPGAMTLDDDVGPVQGWAALDPSDARRIIFTPASPLALQRNHMITVAGGLRDTSGRSLSITFRSTFRTGPQAGPGNTLLAGAAAVDATPRRGVPLAGFGGGHRRLPFPDLNPFDEHTFLRPSEGTHDPIFAKALVLSDGSTMAAIITLDAIATSRGIVLDAVRKAAARGVPLTEDQVMVCSSHTHSGPGAVTNLRFWELAAADLFVQHVFDAYTDAVAESLVRAWSDLGPAHLGTNSTSLRGVSKNRRASDSPFLTRDSIDDELGVIRVDRPDGTPVATVWNFALHGTALGTSNMHYSADIMGGASAFVQADVGGVALFANGAEGDIAPLHGGFSGIDTGGRIIADAIIDLRRQTTTTASMVLSNYSEVVPFGDAVIDLSIQRTGGSMRQINFIQTLANLGINPGMSISLGSDWLENEFRFQAIRLGDTVIASVPGEAIHELGLQIKDAGRQLGFQRPFVFGLANGHMSYIATEREWHLGGYEGMATFFGARTANRVLDSATRVMTRVR